MRAVEWHDGRLRLLDQRLLPATLTYLDLNSADAVADAIREMAVRGAPAIGIAAAYAVVLAARARYREHGPQWQQFIGQDLALLNAARPTAVNLAWALARMRATIAAGITGDPEPVLLAQAQRIHSEDVAANRRMGEFGAALLGRDVGVLTHCNTGSLATGGYGTALGVIRAGMEAGMINAVYAGETRPWLQGARLTVWELAQDGIPAQLITDSAAAHLLKSGRVHWVIVGADRIAANGDTANKIGTYQLAIVARHHGVKFMVAAPISTIDLATATGADIAIEARAESEILAFQGQRHTHPQARAWNPAFDVTPAELIDAIVTERGVVRAPTADKIRALVTLGPN